MKDAASALTRRQLFEGGGALVVMFALPGCGADESAAPVRFADEQLGAWLRIGEDGGVTVFTGKAELGQGIRAALAQIAADELDVPYRQMTIITADTALTPDEGYTFGSLSVQRSGSAIRRAAAEARLSLRELAAEKWKVPIDNVSASNGALSDGRRSISYGVVLNGAIYQRTVSNKAPLKDPAEYRTVGQPLPRPDIPGKVFGAESYLQDLRLPDMAFGRIVRPPRYGAALVSVDTAEVEETDGVLTVVRDGSFLGVIATREEIAQKAADRLRQSAQWSDGEAVTLDRDISALVRSFEHEVTTLKTTPDADENNGGDVSMSAVYERPFQAHASMAPSAAAALWKDGRLHLWTHSQGVYPLRGALAEALGLPEESIRVTHRDGAGCYGHNGADDAAMDAVILAMAAPGVPVKLQWSREDEFQWEPYGPAMLMEVEARLDKSGRIASWTYDVSGFAHSNRPGGAPGNLIAAQTRADAISAPAPLNIPQPTGGLDRNAIPLYDLSGQSIRERFIKARPVRTSSLRALGAYGNVFAIESFMDELAAASRQDPIEFRFRHLTEERAQKVIATLAEVGNWSAMSGADDDWRGRGVAFARYKNLGAYYAAIVDVTVDPASGEIALDHIFGVVDCGLVVNPDGARNQIEGGAIQSASWTLLEQATFEDGRSSARDWLSYPILTFDRIPEIETVFVEYKNEPSLGVGEASQGPIAAAIANAIYAAAGIRLRKIPLTPARVLEALSEKENREG